MKITICIGSSCHLKGSKKIVSRLQELVDEKGLADKVELAATFCLGRCAEGVSVMVDDEFHSVSPETADAFFEEVTKDLK